MGTTNYGSQEISIKYGSPINSGLTENIIGNLLPVGIYSGGYVTVNSINSVSISPLVCSISDGTYQLRIKTTAAVSLTGLTTNPTYIVLRWAYSAVTNNYMDVLALTSSPNANDLIIAKLTGIGTSIVVDYSLRTTPSSKNLLVEPTETPSMYLRIRGGKTSFGISTYDIVDQLSPLFSTAGLSVGQSRIDVIGINSTGSVSVISGTPATTGSQLAPSYGNILALAEITIAYGISSIDVSSIRNVQNAVKIASSDPIGSGKIFFGNSAPTGYLICDGSAISRTAYAALFAVIGTIWGVGDGSTTFNLPDMRKRVPAGFDATDGALDFGTLGNYIGEEKHQLTIAELARHLHRGPAASLPGSGGLNYPITDALNANRFLDGTGYEGNDEPHNNIQPTAVVNWIIKY